MAYLLAVSDSISVGQCARDVAHILIYAHLWPYPYTHIHTHTHI